MDMEFHEAMVRMIVEMRYLSSYNFNETVLSILYSPDYLAYIREIGSGSEVVVDARFELISMGNTLMALLTVLVLLLLVALLLRVLKLEKERNLEVYGLLMGLTPQLIVSEMESLRSSRLGCGFEELGNEGQGEGQPKKVVENNKKQGKSDEQSIVRESLGTDNYES